MTEAATTKAKHARGKGKRGEREVCKLLQKYGYESRRGWQSRGGKAEADIIADTFPFRIECKYAETLNIYAAFQQIDSDSPSTENIVLFRKNGTKWRVAVDFETFMEILSLSRWEIMRSKHGVSVGLDGLISLIDQRTTPFFTMKPIPK